MSMTKLVAPVAMLALLALFTTACSQPEVSVFAVRVEAQTNTQQPLVGVNVWLNGQPLEATDAQGVTHGQAHGGAGSTAELTVACPPGFRSPPPRRIGLRPPFRTRSVSCGSNKS